MTVMFNNGSRKSKTRPNGGFFKPKPARKPMASKKAKSAKGFAQFHAQTDEDGDGDVTSPVDRGVDSAEIDFVSSHSRAKRNVKAMRRAAAASSSHRQTHGRPTKDKAARAKDLDEDSGQGDWRFI